jgi:hypothetical protein
MGGLFASYNWSQSPYPEAMKMMKTSEISFFKLESFLIWQKNHSIVFYLVTYMFRYIKMCTKQQL